MYDSRGRNMSVKGRTIDQSTNHLVLQELVDLCKYEVDFSVMNSSVFRVKVLYDVMK